VYRQSARRWLSHPPSSRLPLFSTRPAVSSVAFIHQMVPHNSTHPIAAHYSFIDPIRMKGWVGLVGRPVADGLPTVVVTHQLQVERGTGKVHRPETNVLPLCNATNLVQCNRPNTGMGRQASHSGPLSLAVPPWVAWHNEYWRWFQPPLRKKHPVVVAVNFVTRMLACWSSQRHWRLINWAGCLADVGRMLS